MQSWIYKKENLFFSFVTLLYFDCWIQPCLHVSGINLQKDCSTQYLSKTRYTIYCIAGLANRISVPGNVFADGLQLVAPSDAVTALIQTLADSPSICQAWPQKASPSSGQKLPKRNLVVLSKTKSVQPSIRSFAPTHRSRPICLALLSANKPFVRASPDQMEL